MSKKMIVKSATENATATAPATPATAAPRGRKPGGTNFIPYRISQLTALIGNHTDAEIQVSRKWLKTFQVVFPSVAATTPSTEVAEKAGFSVE